MENISYVKGNDCEIHSSAILGEGCRLGNNVIIHPNVTLYKNTVIGNNVEIFENSVIGRPPKSAGNLVHKLKKEYDAVFIGDNCVIGAGVVIYAENHIANNVMMGDNACLRECCTVEEYCVIARFVTTNHHVIIRHHSKIMDYTHITAHSTVEENVFIGVSVITANDSGMRLTGSEVGKKGGIIFKNGCRIGSGAIILPGITIGERALVGAGAVVTKDVSPDTTVIGLPARERNI